jgi:hypothetical protein
MKKMPFLLVVLALNASSCEWHLFEEKEDPVQPVEWVIRKMSCRLELAPVDSYGNWRYPGSEDSSSVLIPKYYKVGGTHTFMDPIDATRSYLQFVSFGVHYTTANPGDKQIYGKFQLHLYNANLPQDTLMWEGDYYRYFLPEASYRLSFKTARGGGSLAKAGEGILALVGPVAGYPIVVKGEGEIRFYR